MPHSKEESLPIPEQHHFEEKIQELKAFLSWLHDKLKIPAEMINHVLEVMAAAINSNGPGINLLTIAQGWQSVRPRLVFPTLLAGLGPSIVGILSAMVKVFKIEKLEKASENYRFIIEGTNAFTWTLQTIIAAYVLGVALNSEKEVDSSLADFLYMVVASLIAAIGGTIYNIRNNHKPVESKVANFFGQAANILPVGGMVKDTIDGFIPDSEDSYDEHYWLQAAMHLVSLVVATGLVQANLRLSKKIGVFLEYLCAYNVARILSELYKEVDENKDIPDAKKYTLLAAWVSLGAAVPIIISIVAARCHHRDHDALHSDEEEALLKNEEGKSEEKSSEEESTKLTEKQLVEMKSEEEKKEPSSEKKFGLFDATQTVKINLATQTKGWRRNTT